MTEQEEYLFIQKGLRLSVGDKVMVMSKAETNERGWRNYWMPSMNKAIGKVYAILAINHGCLGITLSTEAGMFSFPCYVLKKVEDTND